MNFHRYALPVLALCALGLSACGDDDNNDAPTTTTPQTEPQPQPQSADPLWKTVVFEHEVATNSPDGCISPKRMAIMDNGTFAAGPCVQGGQPTVGTLTPEEQTEFNRRLNLLIEAGNRSRRVCQEIGILNESAIDVTLDNNVTYTPFEEDDARGRCFRGPIEAVNLVKQYVDTLEVKYYPTNVPSPSPSPTITVSPLPTGSPTPTPTGTGSPTPTPTPTPTGTGTPSPTPTPTPTASFTE